MTGTSRGTPTSPASANDGLTRFGATDDAWEAHHTEHPQYNNHFVYDPDPTLPTINGNVGAVYIDVQHNGGRVLGYNMNLHPSSLDEAMLIVQHEFPSDVRVVWKLKQGTCEQVEYDSATLASALSGASGGSGGQVMVEFIDVGTDGAQVPAPTRFNQATFDRLAQPTPDPSFGC